MSLDDVKRQVERVLATAREDRVTPAYIELLLRGASRTRDSEVRAKLIQLARSLGASETGIGALEEDRRHMVDRRADRIDESLRTLDEAAEALKKFYEKYVDRLPLFDESTGFFWEAKEGNLPKLKSLEQDCEELLNALRSRKDTHFRSVERRLVLLLGQQSDGRSVRWILTAQDRKQLRDPGMAKELNKQLGTLIEEVKRLLDSMAKLKESLQAERQRLSEEQKRLNKHQPRERVPNELAAATIPEADPSRPLILMLTHEYERVKAGGVKTVVQHLVAHLKKHVRVDIIERPLEENGRFYYYVDGASRPTCAFDDMSRFLANAPRLGVSIIHVQSINFAAGPNGWQNGGVDELKAAFGAPVVVTHHSFVRHEKTRAGIKPWMENSIRCQDETVRHADWHIVLHEFNRKLLKELYGISEDRIVTIPNGIDLHRHFTDVLAAIEHRTEHLFSKRVTLLYCGRLSEEKGLLELIDAMKLLPQARLVIVGPTDGKLYPVLKERIAKLQVSDRITFTGAIPTEEHLDRVYRSYDPNLAVMPSHHESFPLFALEAISHGVPLIISDVDGPRHIYRPLRLTKSADDVRESQVDADGNPLPGIEAPFAIGVDPRQPASIARAVKWAIAHPQAVHSILRGAMHEIRKKYTWESIAAETLRWYKRASGKDGFTPHYHEKGHLIEIGTISDNVKQRKIGLVGHFKLGDKIPDGVARWDETIFSYLRSRHYQVEGYAFVGSARSTDGVVHFARATEMPELVRKSDIAIAIVRGAEKHAINILDACRDRGILSVFVMPYWGAWKGAFDFADRADVLIAPTKDYALKIRNKTRKDCRYLPFPIDTDFWKSTNSDMVQQMVPEWKGKFVISYVGRLGVPKKVHNIVEPFKKYMLDTGQDVRLLICGQAEGDMGERLKREIKRLGVESHVRYIPRSFTSEEVRGVYCSSDAFLFASAFETYGQSNLEAISCGTPTVAPTSTGYADYAIPSMANLPGYDFAFPAGRLYDEDGNLRADGTPHDWAACFERVRWIKEHPDEAAQIAQKWARFVHNEMSVEQVGRALEQVLSDLQARLK